MQTKHHFTLEIMHTSTKYTSKSPKFIAYRKWEQEMGIKRNKGRAITRGSDVPGSEQCD